MYKARSVALLASLLQGCSSALRLLSTMSSHPNDPASWLQVTPVLRTPAHPQHMAVCAISSHIQLCACHNTYAPYSNPCHLYTLAPTHELLHSRSRCLDPSYHSFNAPSTQPPQQEHPPLLPVPPCLPPAAQKPPQQLPPPLPQPSVSPHTAGGAWPHRGRLGCPGCGCWC
jgi:hypothetical protein